LKHFSQTFWAVSQLQQNTASENIFQESIRGEETHTQTFSSFPFFLLKKVICSATCASACVLIVLMKIKRVQICPGGGRRAGRGKVNHTLHFHPFPAQDSPHAAAACQTPDWDAGLRAARLLSPDRGTHREEDKTERKISRPADRNANWSCLAQALDLGTELFSAVRKGRRVLGCRCGRFRRANRRPQGCAWARRAGNKPGV